jgi:delta(3,5)-delta(2,4)-dienoyl-CoA isomerase
VEKVAERVINVEMNRPQVRNAMSIQMFDEIKACFELLSADKHYRANVLTGAGKLFTAGLDLSAVQESLMDFSDQEISRRSLNLRMFIESVQSSTIAIYKCQKPIIAACQAGVIGGGMDVIGACDIRYCSADAWFQIKEVDIGMAADIGSLQFTPPLIANMSLFSELAYTARRFDATEAKELGLVSKILPDIEATRKAAIETASFIASKSPVAVQGTKHNIQYARDHSIVDSLQYQATWNMSQLQSEDVMKAAMNVMTKSKEPADFNDL